MLQRLRELLHLSQDIGRQGLFMKILLIDNAKGWGGAEEQLLALAQALVSVGHTVIVGVRAGGRIEKKFAGGNFLLWSVPRGGLSGLVALARFTAMARRERFQIVHVHRDHDLPVGKLYAVAAGARLVLTQHCRPSRPSRFMYALAHRIVCVSEYIAADIRTRLPTLRSRISVILNGIDAAAFTSPDPGYWRNNPLVGNRWPLLGTVGGFYKNQIELIGLLPELRKSFLEILLILIGEDEKGKAFLVARAAELGVSDAVLFTGALPRDQMKHALAGIDLQVSTFRNEGFGLSVVEGLMVGTPFVGYRVGGYPEIVEQGGNGILLETIDEILDVTRGLLADNERRQAMGRNAVESVRWRFSLGSMVDAYISLYLLLSEQRTPNVTVR